MGPSQPVAQRRGVKEEGARERGRGGGGGTQENSRLGQIKREVEGVGEVNFVQFCSL